MTKLQEQAIELAQSQIYSTHSAIIRHKYKSTDLKNKLGEIRSQSEEHRTDPKLLELHDLIWHLMDDLDEKPLNVAMTWLDNLNK